MLQNTPETGIEETWTIDGGIGGVPLWARTDTEKSAVESAEMNDHACLGLVVM
jgi:hypothetical protein